MSEDMNKSASDGQAGKRDATQDDAAHRDAAHRDAAHQRANGADTTAGDIRPQLHLLGNGNYAVMVTAAGSGRSHWRGIAVTRWREDPVRDAWGSYILLRDEQTNAVWSAGLQPCADGADDYRVDFSDGVARITRRQGTLETVLEIAVVADHDAELRRLCIRNHGEQTRRLSLTSYTELVVGPAGADNAHPAFSKLFVQTEWDAARATLLATRRHQDANDEPVWVAHCAVVDGAQTSATQDSATPEHETNRAEFLGRGRILRSAQAMQADAALGGHTGCVIDPVFSLRHGVDVAPGASATVTFFTAAADTREGLQSMLESLRHADVDALLDQAATQARDLRQRLSMDDRALSRWRRWAGALLYADPALRAPPDVLERGRGGAPVLWGKGISGDRPVSVLDIGDQAHLPRAQDLLNAQQYWQHMGLANDVVLLNSAHGDAAKPLQDSLQKALEAQQAALKDGNACCRCDVFALIDSDLDETLRDGLLSVARVVLDASAEAPTQECGAQGSVASPAEASRLYPLPQDQLPQDQLSQDRLSQDQLSQDQLSQDQLSQDRLPQSQLPQSQLAQAQPDDAAMQNEHGAPAPKSVISVGTKRTEAEQTRSTESLELANGIGGFIHDGRAYAIELRPGESTPLPWVNIIANEAFGFMVSADGGGYSWAINSQLNTLTPWPNDPVSDSPHDVLYLRDIASGEAWSATAAPMRVPEATYAIEHGHGTSRFDTAAHGIQSELLQWVPLHDAVKLSRLRLRNTSDRRRELAVTAYVEWQLGANGKTCAPQVITQRDQASGALLARNPWRGDFTDRVAFFDMGGAQTSSSGDRMAFLGLHGDVGRPQAMADDADLPGRFGAGLNPCGALRTRITLEAGEEIELRVLLGDADSEASAKTLVDTWRAADLDDALDDVHALWDDALKDLQVRTPERGMDIMLNGWLVYQALACRVWARTAYYQASGAWGFRDQLQDVMALCVTRPDIARQHLLRSAGRQFPEGDVQHWWLPPEGQGVRTHISDDLVWLPYAAAHYLQVTGDTALLDETCPFLVGQPIPEGQHDAFFKPQAAHEKASVYEHCARTLDHAMTLGAHGLPLIGTGDWNDGLNRVGVEGRGESTWLGWFLITTIKAFGPYAEARGDTARAERWRAYAAAMAKTLDGEHGWDGAWYRRGYYDDGTVLGSKTSEEGRIDMIAQSWSVLSGAADADHAAQAMAAVDDKLIRHDDKLALLFTPPFDKTPLNPGYIKGYPPGIRENGGQYTHGAIWSVFAWAGLGRGDKAGALFNLLNPPNHADSAAGIACYKVEPYVSCADVYSVAPHVGRGGWTWYSGSAGWLYRAGIEAILGFHKRGENLHINPCIPAAWPGFQLRYRHRDSEGISTLYVITVDNPARVCQGVTHVELDGNPLPPRHAIAHIPLTHDHREHTIQIRLGPP